MYTDNFWMAHSRVIENILAVVTALVLFYIYMECDGLDAQARERRKEYHRLFRAISRAGSLADLEELKGKIDAFGKRFEHFENTGDYLKDLRKVYDYQVQTFTIFS
jgi:hypothetical protein